MQDARLAAAAPDLLARLIEAESLLARFAESPSLAHSRGVAEINNTLPRIRAAIRNANPQE